MPSNTAVTDFPEVTYVQVQPGCSYCGMYHEGTCPRVEELEYYPDGTLKRVRLRPVQAVEVGTSTDLPDDHHQTGHTCGVDCPQTTWESVIPPAPTRPKGPRPSTSQD